MATITVAQAQERESLREIEGLWRSAFRRLRKNKLALISMWFLLALILVAAFGPLVIPYSYSKQDYDLVTQGPSWSQASPRPA